MVTVSQLAEALTRRPRSQQVDPSELPNIRCNRPMPNLTPEPACASDRLVSIVVVDRDRLIPGIVGLCHLDAQRSEADPYSPEARTELDGNPPFTCSRSALSHSMSPLA